MNSNNFANPRLAALGFYCIPIQPHTFSRKTVNVRFLVFRASNPVRVPTSLSLKFNIHKYLGYTVRVTWRTSTNNGCFERWLDTDYECDAFCKELCQNPIEVICKCVVVRKLMLQRLQTLHKLHGYHAYPIRIVEHREKPRWKQREL